VASLAAVFEAGRAACAPRVRGILSLETTSEHHPLQAPGPRVAAYPPQRFRDLDGAAVRPHVHAWAHRARGIHHSLSVTHLFSSHSGVLIH
jgi:hypothetical protein